MPISKHRIIAGSLLVAFAVLNVWVCIVMLEKINEIPGPTEPFPPMTVILSIIPFLVYVMMAFCVVQLVAGVRMAIISIRIGRIEMVGSIIAIIGGLSLPAGIYAAWVVSNPSQYRLRKQVARLVG